MGGPDHEEKGPAAMVATHVSVDDEVPEYLRTAAQRGFLGTLRHYENLLDKKLGVEAHGYMRRRPEERDPAYAKWHNQAVMFLLWLSSILNLSCFTTGFLGWELGLDLGRSITIIIFATLLGSMVTVRSERMQCFCVAILRRSRSPLTDARFSSLVRAGALPWAPAQVFARSPSRDTRSAGGRPSSSPP